MSDDDAIVVGAGHNGLVTALYLARAGYKMLVLERNEKIGGAVQRGEITRPGFIRDLWSTNQNLFLASPVYKELKDDLARHGLKYANSPNPYSCAFPNGKSLQVYSDKDKTLDQLHQHNPKDVEGWSALYEHFHAFQKSLLPLYATPLIWGLIAIVSGIAALAGYSLFSHFLTEVIAATIARCFADTARVAAGAILAMISDTMMPEAFEQAHDFAGLVTVCGFLAAFILSKLGG